MKISDSIREEMDSIVDVPYNITDEDRIYLEAYQQALNIAEEHEDPMLDPSQEVIIEYLNSLEGESSFEVIANLMKKMADDVNLCSHFICLNNQRKEEVLRAYVLSLE